MSILKDFVNLKLRDKYINILFILILPFFVLGQFYFKLILIVIIFSGIVIFGKKILVIEKSFINIFFLILLIYFLINTTIISSHYYSINARYLTFIGLILYFLVTNYLIQNNILKIQLIFRVYIIFLLLILLDTLYQIIFLKDLFGYPYLFGYKRFSGPFGDEFILGAFLSFFLVPSILFSFHHYKNANFSLKIFLLLFFMFSIYISIKTGERIAFMTILLQIMLSVILFKFSKNFIFAGVLSLSIILTTFTFDKGVKEKYQHFYNLIFNYQNNYIEKIDISNSIKENKNINSISFFNTQSGAHFLTAYEIWKSYPWVGVGIKNFRNESKNENYANIKSHQVKYRAATHPHNYQLEILSETGLFGFLLFNLVVINLIYNFFKESKKVNKNQIYTKIFMIIVLSKYFPFKTDSSIFSSSLGLLFWIFLIYAICTHNKKSNI